MTVFYEKANVGRVLQLGVYNVLAPVENDELKSEDLTSKTIYEKDRIASLKFRLDDILSTPGQRGAFKLVNLRTANASTGSSSSQSKPDTTQAISVNLTWSAPELIGKSHDGVQRILFDDKQPYEISVRCQNVVKKEWLKKRSTVVAMFVENSKTEELDYVGQTEIIKYLSRALALSAHLIVITWILLALSQPHLSHARACTDACTRIPKPISWAWTSQSL